MKRTIFIILVLALICSSVFAVKGKGDIYLTVEDKDGNPIPDIEIELVYLQSRTGGIAIELTRMIRPSLKEIAGGINGLGITGICLTVENLENIHQRLTEEGWKPFTPCVDLTPPG